MWRRSRRGLPKPACASASSSASSFLLTSLGLRRATINRHIRGRLLLSSCLFAAYTLAAIGDRLAAARAGRTQQIRAVAPAAARVRRHQSHRRPAHQSVARRSAARSLSRTSSRTRSSSRCSRWPPTLILRERVFATTAVGAVVIGFALQDTLGNLFAGLAIQIEKPFRVGDWVMVGGQDGMVSEITWRATKMRTKAGNFVVVPNSVLAKDTIINYSEPTRSVRLQVEVGASYDAPPNVVKAVIREALRDAPDISPDRDTEVLLVDFGARRSPIACGSGSATSRRTNARRIACGRSSTTRFARHGIDDSLSDSGRDVARRGEPSHRGARLDRRAAASRRADRSPSSPRRARGASAGGAPGACSAPAR